MSHSKEKDVPIEKILSRNLKRAYNIMHSATSRLFKEYQITPVQFELMETVLLSNKHALSIQGITSSMVSYQPNVTRLVIILEDKGMLVRSGGIDRRFVMVQITSKGRELVDEIQKQLLEIHYSQYKKLSKAELSLLNELLKKII